MTPDDFKFGLGLQRRALNLWLPKRTVLEVGRTRHSAPGWWATTTRPFYGLVADPHVVGGAPDGVGVVHAKKIGAATVVLIVEEYIRFGQEPPEELVALAALAWLEGLVAEVEGRPLRQVPR